MIGETLNGRYYVLDILGTGQNGQTYLAEDRQADTLLSPPPTTISPSISSHLPPKNKRCVIKQFEPKAKDKLSLRKAKYLFAREIKIQKILGRSDRIPNLVDYFRLGDKFYLVHEFIDGSDLSEELGSGKQWQPERAIALLKEILEIVEVAHREKVIHQDIKPSNIIRRNSDDVLMLIDFGSVKKLNNQMANAEGKTSLTVPIGTEGYMAPEQKSIRPRLASDIYGVGMIGIYALTGVEPKNIPLERHLEVVQWHSLITVDEKLVEVLDRMVSPDFRQRYTSASEALKTVRNLKLGGKLLNLKTAVGTGTILLALLGGGYYYWQLESSLRGTPNNTSYYEADRAQFPFLYRNAEYGIEMKYPFSWQLNEPPSGEQTDNAIAKRRQSLIAIFIPKDSMSYLVSPEVNIEVDRFESDSLEKYTTNAVYEITQLPQAKIIDSRPIEFGSEDGHKVIYTAVNPDNNLQLKYLQIWTTRGDRLYTITYKADAEQYDNFVETVENEMLQSLKIAAANPNQPNN